MSLIVVPPKQLSSVFLHFLDRIEYPLDQPVVTHYPVLAVKIGILLEIPGCINTTFIPRLLAQQAVVSLILSGRVLPRLHERCQSDVQNHVILMALIVKSEPRFRAQD